MRLIGWPEGLEMKTRTELSDSEKAISPERAIECVREGLEMALFLNVQMCASSGNVKERLSVYLGEEIREVYRLFNKIAELPKWEEKSS